MTDFVPWSCSISLSDGSSLCSVQSSSLFEAFNPGFFIAVPGTVLIILGILFVLGIDIFSSPFGVVVGVAIAIAAAGLTVWLYSWITPDSLPFTLSRDSLAGREGQVLVRVEPDSITGKVLIAGQEWSARSLAGEIPVTDVVPGVDIPEVSVDEKKE